MSASIITGSVTPSGNVVAVMPVSDGIVASAAVTYGHFAGHGIVNGGGGDHAPGGQASSHRANRDDWHPA